MKTELTDRLLRELASLGGTPIPEEIRSELARRGEEELQLRVGNRLFDRLSPNQKTHFDILFKAEDEVAITSFVAQNCQDIAEVIEDETGFVVREYVEWCASALASHF